MVPSTDSCAMPHPASSEVAPGVVCLHANASSSAQWRALTNRLAHDYRVFAPDTLGAGQGPAWPPDRAVMLRDEVALLERTIPRFALDSVPGAGHFLHEERPDAVLAVVLQAEAR